MTVCARCGRQNDAAARFCSECGEFLDWEAVSVLMAPPVAVTSPGAGSSPGTEQELDPGQELGPGQISGPAPMPRPVDTAAGPALPQTVRVLDEARRLAEQHHRPDVGEHLAQARQRLTGQQLGVAVVGEFKRGKSTLVNAILQTDICPVDADIVTSVPTLIRYGSSPSGIAHLSPLSSDRAAKPAIGRGGDGGEGEPVSESFEEPVDVEHLFELVSEAADPRRRHGLQSVEVLLPHRLLRTGLCLIDTPGVGGLDSAHGVVTLATLNNACGMIFVTDASQELTAPEIEFLRLALERCPAAICVVTKIDLHPEWRRIAELDRRHLAAAGIDLPLVPVTSFLRLRALHEPALNAESGFVELFAWLRTAVVEAAVGEAVSAAGRDLGFAQDQLLLAVEAEQQVLAEPENSEQVVAGLRTNSERTRRLLDAGTGWQQFLYDGVEDLVADVRHDLSDRIRLLTSEVESVIDQGDPKDSWPEVEVWLQRHLVRTVTENHDLLRERAQRLAGDVADSFTLDSEVPLELGLNAPADLLRGLALNAPQTTAPGGSKATRMMFTGRSAALVPAMIVSYAMHASLMLGVGLLPPALILGAGIGRRMMKDERERQLLYRRQQAKLACRRYLDEASFSYGHQSQESLRRTRRELRDEFHARAAVLHASSQQALDSAERASRLTPGARQARTTVLAQRSREIEHLTAAAVH